jgi:DNA replication licensing factor MCM4
MSSPPALDFPSSDMEDVAMNDGTAAEQSMPDAPPPGGNLLFLPATPSAAGTPARQRYSNAPDSTPLRGVMARRALGMETPKRTPLFMRKKTTITMSISFLLIDASLDDSSPAKTPQRRVHQPSDAPLDSDPLDFPS